jgi:hypothetical protein
MDDLKIYATNDTQLKHMIKIVHKFSEDIGMTFGLDKCKTTHINKGKLINNNEEAFRGIQAMTIEEEYEYLGIKQATSIDHTNIKKDITKQFQKRLIALLKTELNGKNIIKAINTFATPVLMYSYGIIKWTETDLESLQRKIRTILTKYGAQHPNANAKRMTLSRCEDGRGILDVQNLHNKQIINL